MCVVTISSRYQVTIPKEIRERFNIMPGDLALFIPHGKTMGIVFARSAEELAEKKSLYKTSEFPPSGTMFENPDVWAETMPRQISEERTRKEMIDLQLERAGWYLRDRLEAFMRSN